METLLTRYRNITVLLLVIFAQLVLIAVQVRNDRDTRIIRVWSVTAVTPLARLLETVRGGVDGFFQNYISTHNAREENTRLRADVDRLKMENHFLKAELATADRARALAAFQTRTPSKTVAGRVIATGAGANSKVVFVDRGSGSGVEKGMPVVTPDGIVGKVIAAYPTASEVMLITDPDFAAGVISQKNGVVGTLKGLGRGTCKVDYVPNEEKVEPGEWFYTSGDDRVFPKGFPVGVVRVVRKGSPYQEILVEPASLERGLEAVLIMIEGVHQEIPETPPANAPVYLGPPPPPAAADQDNPRPTGAGTDADRLRLRYQQIGAAENHKFGEGLPGSKPPDFNLKLPPASAEPQGSDAETRKRADTEKKTTAAGDAQKEVPASPRPPVPAPPPAAAQP